MAKLKFNEEEAKKLLTVYTTPDVVQQRREILEHIKFNAEDRVLDVGSGPGFLAREISEKIGDKGFVNGVDISDFLINVAESHNKDLPMVNFGYGEATDLKFENSTFNAVICTQVLEYVQNVDLALKEFNRVTKTGGKVVILDTDWDSIVWNSSDKERMSKILKAWEAHIVDPFLPRTLANRMENAGLKIEAIKIIPIFNPKYNSNTYSNGMIDFILPFVTEHGNITEEEARLWSEDLRNPDNDTPYFFSLNRYLFIGTKV